MTRAARLAVFALLPLLGACNSAAPPPPAAAPSSAPVPNSSRIPYVTAPGFKLPEGAGCSGDVARYQAVMDNDLETGHVNKSVHAVISGEIAQARSACAGGRDGEARGLIAASKKRHGYPV